MEWIQQDNFLKSLFNANSTDSFGKVEDIFMIFDNESENSLKSRYILYSDQHFNTGNLNF